MVRGKKSILFIIDVVIGFTIIVIGIILLLSYYYDVPISEQPSFYTQDIISFITATEFGSFHTLQTQQWLANGFVEDRMLIGEKLSDFCIRHDIENFTILMNATIQNERKTTGLLPSHINFYVRVLNQTNPDDVCLQYPANPDMLAYNRSSITSASRSLLLYVNDTYNIHNHTLEVAVW